MKRRRLLSLWRPNAHIRALPPRHHADASKLRNRFCQFAAAFAAVCSICFLAPVNAAEKPQVLVLTDSGNEPDDSESLVRFLLYANEFEVAGLLATTSQHQRSQVRPELIEERVRAYGQVLGNLRVHANGYPTMANLLARIRPGQAAFGMDGVGPGRDTPASEWVISTVDQTEGPVWILIWGGAVDLAQALSKVRAERSEADLRRFVARLRVYSISDQDDAGPWVRRNFPEIWWVVSLHAYQRYNLSTWSGISGEHWYHFDPGGPDSALVSNEWLETHVRRGPLGALYPPWRFIMEGDTPSFLGLISNGLNIVGRPELGGWGGRYDRVSRWDNIYTDTSDKVVGADGREHQSSQATIWRWREAYQNDFAARTQWSVQRRYRDANHNPRLVLNGAPGVALVEIEARPGDTVFLDTAGSMDPDADALRFRWFQYREAGAVNSSPALRIDETEPGKAQVLIPAGTRAGAYHYVLEARDDGTLPLFTYRRAIVNVRTN